MSPRVKPVPVTISNTHTAPSTVRSEAAVLTVRTLGGRQISAPPRIRVTSAAVANRDLLSLREWLVNQSQAEARARGDDAAQTLFRGLNPRNFSDADASGCNLYLFGETHPEFDARTGEQLTPR